MYTRRVKPIEGKLFRPKLCNIKGEFVRNTCTRTLLVTVHLCINTQHIRFTGNARMYLTETNRKTCEKRTWPARILRHPGALHTARTALATCSTNILRQRSESRLPAPLIPTDWNQTTIKLIYRTSKFYILGFQNLQQDFLHCVQWREIEVDPELVPFQMWKLSLVPVTTQNQLKAKRLQYISVNIITRKE